MEETRVIDLLAALAHPTRLTAFRKLVACQPEGIAAGALARALAVPQSTLSAHLHVLGNAGLVSSTRRSRSIVYRAELASLRDALLFLLADCCGGRPEICAPLLASLGPCRPLETDHN